jgi:hypothetical protein
LTGGGVRGAASAGLPGPTQPPSFFAPTSQLL